MRKANSITKATTGPKAYCAPMTAPSAPAPKSIAGFSKLKVAGGPRGPTMKGQAPTMNAPKDGVKGSSMSGGPSRAGPGFAQGGTSNPTVKTGPSGLGQSGSRYPGTNG